MKLTKRLLAVLLCCALCLSLTSCFDFGSEEWGDFFHRKYENLLRNSLEDYADVIRRNTGCYYSSYGIDDAGYFVPTSTFLDDFPYVDGTFVWRLDAAFMDRHSSESLTDLFPEITLLAVTYEEQVYREAKQCMLDVIPPYDDTRYIYGRYVFYENANYIEQEVKLYGERVSWVPLGFTMACYNDERHTLVFIGMESFAKGDYCIPDIYQSDIEHNWVPFIDRYYGLYYDFSE